MSLALYRTTSFKICRVCNSYNQKRAYDCKICFCPLYNSPQRNLYIYLYKLQTIQNIPIRIINIKYIGLQYAYKNFKLVSNKTKELFQFMIAMSQNISIYNIELNLIIDFILYYK